MIDANFVNTLILILIDVLGVWVALWVYLSNRMEKVNFGLSAMIITILLWINFYHIGYYSSDEPSSLLFFKISGASVFGFFIAYYFFTVRWFFQKSGVYKWIGNVTLIYGFLFAYLTILTNRVIGGVKIESWGSYPIFSTIGWITFYGYVTLLTIIIIYTLVREYGKSDHYKRQKIKYFLYGIFVFTVLNVIFNVLFQVVLNEYRFYQFGNYSTVILIGLTLYAIVKQELFNIKVIATKVITAILWVLLFLLLFTSQSILGVVVNGSIFVAVVIFGIFLNRTVAHEVKQKEELQVLTDKLKELDKQKDEFINVAAHELRAPMTAIKGFLSMVNEGDTGQITDKTREYISDAVNGNERLIRLVNNMLNIARIEEGRMVYQMGVVELDKVAREIVKNFETEAQNKGLQIYLTAPENLNSKVYVDPDRIYEVVGNFVSNSVKYTEKGSVTVKLSNPNSQTIRMEVIDTGVGVTKDEQGKLFKKFERAQSSAGKIIGTGLGLYISKLLIEKFGGRVGLVSEYGKGSNFWFDLPISG